MWKQWHVAALFGHTVFFLCVRVCAREDDKNSVDIHDNPPAPDNVVREDGDTVSDRTMSTPHCQRCHSWAV